MTNARAAIDAFSKDEKLTLSHGFGQFALYREFTPGEAPTVATATRVLPAYFMATAVPNASVSLGDNTGPYIGSAGRSAVMFDPTWGPQHNVSGLGFYLAGLGGGKSTLAGLIAESSARRGVQTIIFDPSGPLAKLTRLPYLAGHARHVELSGAASGTLNPYLLVPDPRKHDHASDREWRAAMQDADAERRELMIDTILMLLPPRLVSENSAVPGVVEDAVNMRGGAYGNNPWAVVDALGQFGETGEIVANRLKAAATMSGGALIFPDQDDYEPAAVDFDTALTVLTMRGITVPPKDTPREFWNRAELRSAPLIYLASRYAGRAMYANTAPKVIFTDEGAMLNGGASSFRAFTLRSSRDTRKTNTHFGILSQNPSDLLAIDPEVANLSGCAFVGHMKSEQAAKAALPFLGAPDDHGYEKVLTAMPPGAGQFVMRDYKGQVGQVQIDRDYRPHMADALDTTPEGNRDSDDDWAVEA